MTVGTKRNVFTGKANSTTGGVHADGIAKNPKGRLVYVAKSEAARKNPALTAWRDALADARKQLGITGFEPLKKGSSLYKLTKEIYDLNSHPLMN